MLPAAHRMRRREDFTSAVRAGRRAGGAHLVVHLLTPAEPSTEPVRVGLIVSKAVGSAVVRTLVKRRLRSVVRPLLSTVPGGSLLVLRATAASSSATSAVLARDLDRALQRLLSPAAAR